MAKVGKRYRELLEELLKRGYSFLTCRKYHQFTTGTESNIVHPPIESLKCAIRHDVDNSLDKALELAKFESSLGIRSTYFILHTAAYYKIGARIPVEKIRALGHEIGFHNNLVSLVTMNADPKHFLKFYIDDLQPVYGTTPHGGFIANKFKFSNAYIWDHIKAPPNASHPNDKIVAGRPIPKLRMSDYFEYDGNNLESDIYWFDNAEMQIEAYLEGGSPQRLVMLIHPCHWVEGGKHDTAESNLKGGKNASDN